MRWANSQYVCMYVSGIHTYMLGGPCLDRPPEAQKIKFRTGSPECFKTIAETKVWTHFLVQAGYLDFGASEASDAKHVCMYMYACMYVCEHTCSTYLHTYIPTQLMRGIHMYVFMYEIGGF